VSTSDPAPRPDVYTSDEAAVILRVKKSWLERQASFRKIPFTMLGGSYRFSNEHLQEIVRLFEQQPGQATRDESARPHRRPRASRQQLSDDAAPVAQLRPRPRPDGPRRKESAA
jgi:excisionase family DNA binding protein